MDRNTDITNMDAPAVNSGKYAGDTILAVKDAVATTPSERESNQLKEYTTPAQPTKGAGGRAKF